ncbi:MULTISPECIES: hypothetical protein [unclassified Streptomyces]|uniref:hypothetical protein n=1 Tax=unclassified Streptomyces TaxID=2593676 RepID=UPI003FD28057
MEIDLTSEERSLLSYLGERLAAGDNPTEDDLAEQLGEDVRQRLRSLADKELVSLGVLPEGGPDVVFGLSPEAQEALGIHRDATE